MKDQKYTFDVALFGSFGGLGGKNKLKKYCVSTYSILLEVQTWHWRFGTFLSGFFKGWEDKDLSDLQLN